MVAAFVQGQDTSAVGEGGAREVVWVGSLREDAKAAQGELLWPKPRPAPGTRDALTEPQCV